MAEFIMQMRPLFGVEEKQALMKYMEGDVFLTEFKQTEKFEGMIAKFVGAKHCIVVNNGTISLTLAAIAAGIKADDEVIVPNFTMIATPNSLKFFGAKPVLVDVEIDTLCMDIRKVEEAITPKTKAIILVSANGRYPKSGIKKFEELCLNNKLIMIEDAAQSLGSFYPDGRHIGTAGLVGSFSFSAPKIISTGQGGALVTDCDVIARKLRKLKDFGRMNGGNDIHDEIGYNFKFTDLQACVGIEQMKKLKKRIKRKKILFDTYRHELEDIKEVELFTHNLETTAPWFIDCLVLSRSKLMNYLFEAGIGTRVMYPPINNQQAYQYAGQFPVSNLIGRKGLWLPSSVQLTVKDVKRICSAIKEFYKLENILEKRSADGSS